MPVKTENTSEYLDLMRSVRQVWRKPQWSPEESHCDDGRYEAVYRFSDDQQGERPLLHGPLLSHLVMFHGLVSGVFAYTQRHFPVLDALPRVSDTEAKQRVTITSLHLRLHAPVSGPLVPLTLTFERFVDTWESRRMIFAALAVEVAGGKHTARMHGCYDFRDRLSASSADEQAR